MSKRTFDAFREPSSTSPPNTNTPHGIQYSSLLSPGRSQKSESTSDSPKPNRFANGVTGMSQPQAPGNSARNMKNSANAASAEQQNKMPSISRKVKACAACRKQKIKCIMPGEPPCQRCKERGLSCRLNKSLQTLMSEDSRWKSSVTKDLANIHSSLEHVLQSLSLPPLPASLLSTHDPATLFDQDEQGNEQEEDDQSYDNSPKATPMSEHVPPIESLYQITGIKSLRSRESVMEEQNRICKQLRDTDFISKGVISLEDAEHLATYFLTRLDPYIYSSAGDYQDLDSFRRRSPTLTACVLTVAALHDKSKEHLYPICNKEYRRLVANAMFERRIDMEYLRALVVGSYWLSDISWTLSGYAIRRASEFHLRSYYFQILEAGKEPSKVPADQLRIAMDRLRLLYILYICDHNLSILYGRASLMRDHENYIFGWEQFLASPLATDSDARVASQVSLFLLMSQIRESLGPEDNNTVLPESSVLGIATYERKLDDWVSRWSSSLGHNKHIGSFPAKAVIIHFHFAKLYLTSYVFRGLPESNPVIPDYFLEIASAALAAATSILKLTLEDQDLQLALAGVPHYYHGMMAFASMFLAKAATRHGTQLFFSPEHARVIITSFSQQLKVITVGKDHLLHRMAEGLEKMAETIGDDKSNNNNNNNNHHQHQQSRTPQAMDAPSLGPGYAASGAMNAGAPVGGAPNGQMGVTEFDMLDPNSFGFNESTMGFGMPFFDFEGATLDLDPQGFSF